jgi:hypothetical protein
MTASLWISGERCEYRIVISIVACPSSSWIAFSGTPRIVRCEAKVEIIDYRAQNWAVRSTSTTAWHAA